MGEELLSDTIYSVIKAGISGWKSQGEYSSRRTQPQERKVTEGIFASSTLCVKSQLYLELPGKKPRFSSKIWMNVWPHQKQNKTKPNKTTKNQTKRQTPTEQKILPLCSAHEEKNKTWDWSSDLGIQLQSLITVSNYLWMTYKNMQKCILFEAHMISGIHTHT